MYAVNYTFHLDLLYHYYSLGVKITIQDFNLAIFEKFMKLGAFGPLPIRPFLIENKSYARGAFFRTVARNTQIYRKRRSTRYRAVSAYCRHGESKETRKSHFFINLSPKRQVLEIFIDLNLKIAVLWPNKWKPFLTRSDRYFRRKSRFFINFRPERQVLEIFIDLKIGGSGFHGQTKMAMSRNEPRVQPSGFF